MADWKASVDAVANKQIDLDNTTTIVDGVTLGSGMRVLARRQALPEENGIYDVSILGAWSRSADFDTTDVKNGVVVYVKTGHDNTGKIYASSFDETGFTLGTDPIPFPRVNISAGTFDPTDYGAVTTTLTSGTDASDDAFPAMFAEMAPIGYGGPFQTVHLPPGPQGYHYYFTKNLRITRQCIFEGVGPGEYGTGTKLKFAKYTGMIMHSIENSPDGGSAAGTIVRNMMIEGSHLGGDAPEFEPRWTANTPYSLGDKVTPLATFSPSAPLLLLRQTLAYYYECIRAGTSALTDADEPVWVNQPDNFAVEIDTSADWDTSAVYAHGSVVRDPSGMNPPFDVVYSPVSTDGIPIGQTRRPDATVPAFGGLGTYTPDAGPDGTFKWLGVDPSAKFIPDNCALSDTAGLIWGRKMCCGIWAMTIGRIENVVINGFLNAAIGAVSGVFDLGNLAGYTPPANVNGLNVSNVQIQSCGVGTNLVGPDAGACSFYDLNIIFNPPAGLPPVPDERLIGVQDQTLHGNRYVGVQMNGAKGAGTYVARNAGSSTFVGLYQEESEANDCRAGNTSYWGGVTAAFTDWSIFYGAPGAGDWTGVVTTSVNPTGYLIKSTFHDRTNSFIFGFGAKDTEFAGYAMQYADAALGQGYWAWEYTGGAWPNLAMTTSRALEGFGHVMHVDGYLAGRTTNDRRYTFESTDSVHYQQIKYGVRTIGDRVVSNSFAKRGGFASRVVTRDGFNAGTRTAPTLYTAAAQTGGNAAATNMIEADVNGVTHVFACVSTGTSDDLLLPPNFNTALPDPVYRMCWTANSVFEIGASCGQA